MIIVRAAASKLTKPCGEHCACDPRRQAWFPVCHDPHTGNSSSFYFIIIVCENDMCQARAEGSGDVDDE